MQRIEAELLEGAAVCSDKGGPMRSLGTWELRFTSPFSFRRKCSRASDHFSFITAKNIKPYFVPVMNTSVTDLLKFTF